MVTCWDCLKTLPYDCVCPVSDKTKSLRWAEKVVREAELFIAILEGFKPTIKINGKNCISRTKIVNVGTIEIDTEDVTFASNIVAVLLDKNGVPLYRRKFSKQRFFDVGYIGLCWNIGTIMEG